MNNELLVYEIRKMPLLNAGKPAVYDDHGMMTFAELYSQTEILRIKLIELGVKPGMGMGAKPATDEILYGHFCRSWLRRCGNADVAPIETAEEMRSWLKRNYMLS
jgi:hypothetical protein